MNRLNKYTYPLIIGVLVLCLVAALYGVLWTIINSKERKAAEMYSELAIELQKESHAKELSGFLDDVRKQHEHLRTFFASKDQAVTLIEELESFSTTTGASIEIIQVAESSSLAGDHTLVIDVSVEGSWQSVVHALELFESVPLQNKISQISLDGTATGWTLRGSLEVGLES